MSGIWELLKRRIIGAHMISLSGRTVDGFDQFRTSVDCMEQLRGTREECEREWRQWVRVLNKIARERGVNKYIGGRDK